MSPGVEMPLNGAIRSDSVMEEVEVVKGAHIREIFDDDRLAQLRATNALADVTLMAGPAPNRVSIRAHKVILSLASGFFWKNLVQTKDTFKIPMSSEVLTFLLDYIYTGKAPLTDDNVEELYQNAILLEMTSFMDKCLEFMGCNINESNWDRRLLFAFKMKIDDLRDLVLSYFCTEYEKHLRSDKFLGLGLDQVTYIISNPARLELPEETVFTCIIKWLNFKKSDRARVAHTLIEDIDLKSIAEDFLQFHFDTEEVLRSVACLELYHSVVKPKENHVETVEDTFVFSEPESIPEPPKRQQKEKASASTSGNSLKRPAERLKQLKRRSQVNISEEADLPPAKKVMVARNVVEERPDVEPIVPPIKLKSVARKKTGGVRQNYKVIESMSDKVVTKRKESDGASESSKSSTSPARVNRKSNSSTRGSIASKSTVSIKTKSLVSKLLYLRETNVNEYRVMMTDLTDTVPQILRPFHKCNRSTTLVWAGGNIRRLYALGGIASVISENGSSAEVRYTQESSILKSSDRDKYWMKAPAMAQARTSFMAVVLGDFIYAFGGAEGICGNEAVNSAEKLSLTHKNAHWTDIDYLARARHGFGAGVINGKIYVCGGYGAEDDKEDCRMGILNTVEVYNPELDQWSFVNSMIRERHGLCIAVLDSKLYAIGGGGINSHTDFKADFPNMKSVEMYDPEENCWSQVASMNRPRKNGSAVALRGKIFVVGGDVSKGEREQKSSVEVYDPELDKWDMVIEELDQFGRFSSVVVVDDIDT